MINKLKLLNIYMKIKTPHINNNNNYLIKNRQNNLILSLSNLEMKDSKRNKNKLL